MELSITSSLQPNTLYKTPYTYVNQRNFIFFGFFLESTGRWSLSSLPDKLEQAFYALRGYARNKRSFVSVRRGKRRRKRRGRRRGGERKRVEGTESRKKRKEERSRFLLFLPPPRFPPPLFDFNEACARALSPPSSHVST